MIYQSMCNDIEYRILILKVLVGLLGNSMAESDERFPLQFNGPIDGVKYPVKVQYVDGMFLLLYVQHV